MQGSDLEGGWRFKVQYHGFRELTLGEVCNLAACYTCFCHCRHLLSLGGRSAAPLWDTLIQPAFLVLPVL